MTLCVRVLGDAKGSPMPATFSPDQNIDRPLWTAPRLAAKLCIHHFTLLKLVQGRRGKFDVPAGAFKVGKNWRWRDEDVQAFFLTKSGVVDVSPPAQIVVKALSVKRGPGRPPNPMRTGGAV